MKPILNAILALLLILSMPLTWAADTINIATGEWPPFISKQVKHNGVFAHIITQAFAQQGINVKYHYYPWKRAIYEAREGNDDGTGPWRKRGDLNDDFLFSDTFLETGHVFFHLKSFNFNWQNYDDLAGIHMAGSGGYYYNQKLDDALKVGSFKMTRVTKEMQGVEMLLLGRVDLFPMNLDSGYQVLRANLPPEQLKLITHHPKSLTPEDERPLYLLLSKRHPKSRSRIESFNQGLKKLKANGQYQEIINNLRMGVYKNR